MWRRHNPRSPPGTQTKPAVRHTLGCESAKSRRNRRTVPGQIKQPNQLISSSSFPETPSDNSRPKHTFETKCGPEPHEPLQQKRNHRNLKTHRALKDIERYIYNAQPVPPARRHCDDAYYTYAAPRTSQTHMNCAVPPRGKDPSPRVTHSLPRGWANEILLHPNLGALITYTAQTKARKAVIPTRSTHRVWFSWASHNDLPMVG